jgi:hypothetical protein
VSDETNSVYSKQLSFHETRDIYDTSIRWPSGTADFTQFFEGEPILKGEQMTRFILYDDVTVNIRAVLSTSSLLRLALGLQGSQERFPYYHMNVCFDVFSGLIINRSVSKRPFRIFKTSSNTRFTGRTAQLWGRQNSNSVPTIRQKSQMFSFPIVEFRNYSFIAEADVDML